MEKREFPIQSNKNKTKAKQKVDMIITCNFRKPTSLEKV